MPALAPPVHAEPEDLGEVLIDTGRIIEQTQYRMITTAAAFASSDQWIRAGYRTAAHWISDHVGVCVSTAREWIRVGRKLIEMPELDRAFASRALTYSKVRTLTRIATPGTAQELVDLAVMTPSDYLHHALAEWSKRNEDDDTRAARHHLSLIHI